MMANYVRNPVPQLEKSPWFDKTTRPFTPQILILTHQKKKKNAAFENIVGKKEIARNEHFLLLPQCFLLNQMIVSSFVHM